MSVRGVYAEVPARGECDVRLLQGSLAELPGGQAGVADVEVDVERAVGRDGYRQPDPVEAVEHQRAPRGILRAARLADREGVGGEAGQGGVLRGGRPRSSWSLRFR